MLYNRFLCKMSDSRNIYSGINRNTPARRIGLSRKRKKLCSGEKSGTDSPMEDSTFVKVSKQLSSHEKKFTNKESLDTEVANSEDQTKSGHNTCETPKPDSKAMSPTTDLENLYSLWRTGCKNALFYLIKLIEERTGEDVDVKKLLQDLGIWEIMSSHFADDIQMDFFQNDYDDDDDDDDDDDGCGCDNKLT